MSILGLYLHIPFCKQRCNYCDFNTYAGIENYISDYTAALCEEVMRAGQYIDQSTTVNTIYFGGGTPSLMQIDHIKKIVQIIKENFKVKTNPEITFEVNPGTVSREYLSALYQLGINRLSIGMQTGNKNELDMLGRIHTLEDVENTIAWAKEGGFKNISLDLIFGLPGQTMQSWKKSVNAAIKLHPQHLSLYALTIEANTPLARDIENKNISRCSDDLTADMYEWALESLPANGFKQYEISNWANVEEEEINFQCAHNMQYWRNDDYIGVGAGAHSHYGNKRWENIPGVPGYINTRRLSSAQNELFARINIIDNDLRTEMQETMMLGLRLVEEGVSKRDFNNKYQKEMIQQFKTEIDQLIQLGLVEWGQNEEEMLKLTKRGLLMGNQVFMYFVN